MRSRYFLFVMAFIYSFVTSAVAENHHKESPSFQTIPVTDNIWMLRGTSAEIQTMIDNGFSLEQIKTKGLSKRWESWMDGFLPTEAWISIVYNSLNKYK